jgi:hypothetical protein
MKRPVLGTFVAGVAGALLLACAGGTSDTSSPLRAPGAPSRVLTTAQNAGDPGDGVPNEGEVEVCKYGTDGTFRVLVGASQSDIPITAGTCKVVAVDKSTNQTATAVTVTELASPLYSLVSVERERIDFIVNTQIDDIGPLTPVSDGVSVPVNAFHGSLFVYHNQPVAPPVCDFITFGRLVASLNGQKVVISGNIGGNQPGGGILSEFHVVANGIDNHVANVDTYGPITSGPLSLLTNSRMSTGTAKNGVAVEVRMWDGGEPGKGTDIVYVTLNGVEILGPNGQYLDQGNMQYHSNCRGPG